MKANRQFYISDHKLYTSTLQNLMHVDKKKNLILLTRLLDTRKKRMGDPCKNGNTRYAGTLKI